MRYYSQHVLVVLALSTLVIATIGEQPEHSRRLLQSGPTKETAYEHEDPEYEHYSSYGHDHDDDQKEEYESYPEEREHEYDSYSGKQLVNLEMMEPLEPEELPSTLAMAVSRHRSSRNTTNSTDITIDFGLACCSHTSDDEYSSSSYSDVDPGTLIPDTPKPLGRVGEAVATIHMLQTPKTVKIGKQRGRQVANMTGMFVTLFDYEDSEEPCHPLLAHTTRAEFTNIPVYAMISKTHIPADVSMLESLLPQLRRPVVPPVNPNITPPILPPIVPPGLISSGAAARVNAISNAAIDTNPSVGSRVAVAADSYGYDDYDSTLCGITLVAKGDVTVRVQTSSGAKHFRGTIEAVLLWTDGVITLPGVMADVLANATGQQGRNLFRTTVNQVLSNTVVNGYANAEVSSLVGNSVAGTALDNGQTVGTGGAVNVTQNNNNVTASADDATMSTGDGVSGNTISVVNDLGSILEQYQKLLKTVCKHHPHLPMAKPGNVRLDLHRHEEAEMDMASEEENSLA